jgi:hypothetical protein
MRGATVPDCGRVRGPQSPNRDLLFRLLSRRAAVNTRVSPTHTTAQSHFGDEIVRHHREGASFLVEDTLFCHCQGAAFANLAVDGWSDPRDRRYQGIIARLIDRTEETTALFLAPKEIKAVHDSARKLQLLVDATEKQFGLSPKIEIRAATAA